METLNFLIVGFGGAGKRLLKNIGSTFHNSKVEVINTSQRATINENYEENVFIPLDEAISKVYDCVFITTPTSTHASYAYQLVAVTNLFVIEKPLDAGIEVSERLIRDFNNLGKTIIVGFQRRCNSIWKYVKELFKNENMSEFRYGNVIANSYLPGWREQDYHTRYAANEKLGGGVLLTESHDFDLVQWIFGDIIEVSASCGQTKDYQMDVEDMAVVDAKIRVTDQLRSITFQLDFMSTEIRRIHEYVFENSKIIVDEEKNKIEIYRGSNFILREVKQFEKEDAHIEFLNELKKYLETRQVSDLLCDGRAGLKVNAVIDACKKSVQSGHIEITKPSVFPEEGLSALNKICDLAKQTFGERLLAIYGMGSLGYGGYVNGWSDFDIDIIINIDSEEEQQFYFKQGRDIQEQVCTPEFDRIDIRAYDLRFLNNKKSILQYGQCSRALMLLDSSKLVMGKNITSEVRRPSLEEMNQEAAGLIDTMLSRAEEWWDNLPWDDIAAFYALNARFLYTNDFKQVAGKEKALNHFLDKYTEFYSNSAALWFFWANSLRIKFDKKLIQDHLKADAVKNLKDSFGVTRELLRK